jgi:YggT family protein
MLVSLFTLVVGSLADLLALAFLARFAMQWAPGLFRSPFGRFIAAMTDWAVIPARKIVPGLFGLDLATLLLAWLVQAIYVAMFLGITGLHGGMGIGALGIAVMAGLIETLRLGLYLAMTVIIISAVLSWVNPHAPMAPAIARLAEPILRPVRRIVPPIGGVDLSPIVVLIALQALLIVIGHARGSLLPLIAL